MKHFTGLFVKSCFALVLAMEVHSADNQVDIRGRRASCGNCVVELTGVRTNTSGDYECDVTVRNNGVEEQAVNLSARCAGTDPFSGEPYERNRQDDDLDSGRQLLVKPGNGGGITFSMTIVPHMPGSTRDHIDLIVETWVKGEKVRTIIPVQAGTN
ncbi:MAG: hypothetical protein LBJ16_02765 [Holosporaceae bacterium]|jgi:hypothetical protein|nr:hypothetical protein [Holosporaceae bacterium]